MKVPGLSHHISFHFIWHTSGSASEATLTFGHNSLFRSLHNAADTLGMYLTSHLLLGVTLTARFIFGPNAVYHHYSWL